MRWLAVIVIVYVLLMLIVGVWNYRAHANDRSLDRQLHLVSRRHRRHARADR